MGTEGQVLPLCSRTTSMHPWKVATWFYYMVFPVAQKVYRRHYKSISNPSCWIMQADPLYVFCKVLSLLLSQEDYVPEPFTL